MNNIMKPEVIRYGHMDNFLEKAYLKAMGKKLFGEGFKGFYKETTFMHSKGFITKKIKPIKGTPTKNFRALIQKVGLVGATF